MRNYIYHWVSRTHRGQASNSRAHSRSSQDPLSKRLMMPSASLAPCWGSTKSVAGKDPHNRLASADRWTDAGRPAPSVGGLRGFTTSSRAGFL